jgi:hypothetical protein
MSDTNMSVSHYRALFKRSGRLWELASVQLSARKEENEVDEGDDQGDQDNPDDRDQRCDDTTLTSHDFT